MQPHGFFNCSTAVDVPPNTCDMDLKENGMTTKPIQNGLLAKLWKNEGYWNIEYSVRFCPSLFNVEFCGQCNTIWILCGMFVDELLLLWNNVCAEMSLSNPFEYAKWCSIWGCHSHTLDLQVWLTWRRRDKFLIFGLTTTLKWFSYWIENNSFFLVVEFVLAYYTRSHVTSK